MWDKRKLLAFDRANVVNLAFSTSLRHSQEASTDCRMSPGTDQTRAAPGHARGGRARAISARGAGQQNLRQRLGPRH